MKPVSDSLAMFIEAAKCFLLEEVGISVTEEVIRYVVIYHLDSFSAAYMRYRMNPSEESKSHLERIMTVAARDHTILENSKR